MEEPMDFIGEERRRHLEDVSYMVGLAKLEEKDLKPVSQAFFFGEENSDSNLKILELDKDLLHNIREGNSLIIRGLEDDEAVLCTENATYEMRGAETSNSLLLLNDLVLPEEMDKSIEENRRIEDKTVVSVFHKYYELRKCQPKVNKLLGLLKDGVYRGKEYEADIKDKLYTYEDLQDVIQCSKSELIAALSDIEAYEINGYWRLLEFDYHFRILTYILNLVEENSWPFHEVPKNETLKSLSDLVPVEIMHQCFNYFASGSGNHNEAGDELCVLMEDKICRFLAKVLLKPAGKFNLDEFREAWQQCVPEGMKTDLKQLEGLALVNENESPPVAQYFPESELPDDPGKRFELLFHVKDKWTLDEITPYIERLAPNKAGVSSLLLKFARAYHSPNGKGRLYSAKHTK